jgi:hypothetical protein
LNFYFLNLFYAVFQAYTKNKGCKNFAALHYCLTIITYFLALSAAGAAVLAVVSAGLAVLSAAGAAAGAGAGAGAAVVAAAESVLAASPLPLPQEVTKRPRERASKLIFTSFINFLVLISCLYAHCQNVTHNRKNIFFRLLTIVVLFRAVMIINALCK